jgi:hypothetical protein
MSSHHIVRDDQEPALIANGASDPELLYYYRMVTISDCVDSAMERVMKLI